MQQVFLVITIVALWQLLHFDTIMHGCMLLAFKHTNNLPHKSNGHNKYRRRVQAQETHRVLECSSPNKSNNCNINYLNTTSPSDHYPSGFMIIAVLGHTYLRLLASEIPKSAQGEYSYTIHVHHGGRS